MLERFCNLIFKSEQSRSILGMLIGSIFIGVGPFFVKFSAVSAETNTFYRLLVGTVFFMVYSLVKKELRINLSFFAFAIFSGGLLVLDLFLWNQGVLYVGPGISTILANLEIVFLVLLGRLFFAEKVDARFLWLLACIAIGSWALLSPLLPELTLQSNSALGIFFALSASLSYALYIFSIKFISQKFPEQTSTGILTISCLTGCILLGVVIWSRDLKMFSLPSWHSGMSIFTNAILSQVIGWYLISKGIARLSLSLSGLILLLQPAITFFLDSLFLARNANWLQMAGCLCLLSSIFIATKKQKIQKESNESHYSNS